VTRRDATTKIHAQVLIITNVVQTDAEVGVPNNPGEGHDKSSGSQNNLPPPRVNQSNASVVRRTKKNGNPLTIKENKVLCK